MPIPRLILAAFLTVLLAPPARAAEPPLLPASPYAVKVDGDPREAFLLGAMALPVHDAVTGVPDGSVRAYALATREGLYVALLSTEPGGGAGLLRPLPWAPPEEVVLGDWMAVRLGPPEAARLYVLAPGGYRAVLDAGGRPPAAEPAPWRGADAVFGATWAGEWLFPWKGAEEPGRVLRLEVLRGRKVPAGRYAQESMAHSSPGPASWRWGGEGLVLRAPASIPGAPVSPRALRPYEVRPFVPPGEEAPACEDAAPAGSVVTAWLEVPPGEGRVKVSDGSGLGRGRGLEDLQVFALDFWWQAGTREEIDARFPVRVAAGMGDVLVGERLVPQPPEGFETGPWPLRIVVRAKVSEALWPYLNRRPPPAASSLGGPGGEARPGAEDEAGHVGRGLLTRLAVERRGGPERSLTWEVILAPPLPPDHRLAGVYYLDRDPARWAADLRDLAAHGINAATCPAGDAEGWWRFQEAARDAGVDGRWAMRPEAVPYGEHAWGYACDEPATVDAVEGARKRAEALRNRGLRPWAALAWPNSLRLAGVLDGVSVPPNLVREAPSLPSKKRWVYVQGLREDPFFNRVWAGLLSRAPGLDGFWVFCFSPSREGDADDWAGSLIRYDALVDPDGKGGRSATVQFESLREGILDGRLLDALGPRGETVLGGFPGAADAVRGDYWKARGRGWSFADLRKALVEAWAGAAP